MKTLSITDFEEWHGRLVVFDLDGTLYNKAGLPFRLCCKLWRSLRLLKAERKARKALRGVYLETEAQFYEALFAQIAKRARTTPERAKKWYNEVYMPSMVKALQQHYQARVFVSPLVKMLRAKGIQVVVFSDYGEVENKLQAIGLKSQEFDAVFSAPQLGGLKPCPEAFKQLLESRQVKPQESLMIGDRQDTDGDGARAAGMQFWLI